MSFQSGDAFRPIADKQKYLTDFKHIHNTSSYLTSYRFTKGKNLNKQNNDLCLHLYFIVIFITSGGFGGILINLVSFIIK